MISPLLANIYLHVLDTEFTRRGLGELVRYADDGVVLCRSAAQARAALDAIGEILGSLGLELHPDKITIRHRIPVRDRATSGDGHHDTTDTEGDMRQGYPLCWGRDHPALRRPGDRPLELPVHHHPCLQPQADQLEHPPVRHPAGHLGEQPIMIDLAEEVPDIKIRRELVTLDEAGTKPFHRLRG